MGKEKLLEKTTGKSSENKRHLGDKLNHGKFMTSQRLSNMLRIITDNLSDNEIPYALIGAFALSLYGLPKFTADIDLLTEGRFLPRISPIMGRLGYKCFQKTNSFAQFDSEIGVYGKVDYD